MRFHRRLTQATRFTFRAAKAALGHVLNYGLYEAGKRWTDGSRSVINAPVQDVRHDVTSYTRLALVEKARYFEANSSIVNRMADLFEQNTVGWNGLAMSPDSSDPDYNLAASEWLGEWSQAPDIGSFMPLAAMQSLSARLWFIDGECYILKTRTPAPPYRPMLQLIESHRVASPDNALVRDSRIYDGVQVDDYGRPVFYWVRVGFDTDGYTPIPASQLIHIGEPGRVGQLRCLPMLYPVMNQLHDLDDLERLQMGHAKQAAAIQNVIYTPSGELREEDWTKEEVAAGEIGNDNPLTQYYKRVFGAEWKVAKIGDKFEQLNNNRPSVAEQWYWRHKAEEICNGAGMPFVVVYPEATQGTVYRGAIDSAATYFRSRSAVLQAAWREAALYALEAGSQVDTRIARKPKDWRRMVVRPPKAVNVDVGRNSTAMLAELASGARTFQDIYAETGEDWKAKLRQKATEAKFIADLAKEFGVEPQAITDKAVTAPPVSDTNPAAGFGKPQRKIVKGEVEDRLAEQPRVPEGNPDWGQFTGEGGGGGGRGTKELTRSERAKLSHKPSTAGKQRRAQGEQDMFARHIGAEQSDTGTAAFDIPVLRNGAPVHLIEFKTVMDNKHSKITMHPESRRRKEKLARRIKAKAHTVAVDIRAGSRRYYHKEGVGAFRISAMREVTLPELKAMFR